MDDATFSYLPIDPTTFDLIVVGTGLPESILSAAAASTGKTVLHLDPNPFYGSHFSSLPLSDLPSFLLSHSQPAAVSVPTDADDGTTPSQSDLVIVDLTTRPVYSDVEISSHSSDLLEHSRKFNLDLTGPRVLFCVDSAVDLMLKSGANQYVEFKKVDGTFVCGGDGKLSSVPDSRSAIFKDSSLGLAEKNRLGSFFKLVEGHLKEVGSDGVSRRISEEDLERPFVEFLDKMRLPVKIKSIIIYAIAMADYDQDNLEGCKNVLKTREGINRLALYHSSVGRFHNALGALIYPIYGQGELSQAFCRRAAVKVATSETPENSSYDKSEDGEVKPNLLWSALYIQELFMGSFDPFCFTPMPDGSLNYNDLLDSTKELFHKMFPQEEFFPETVFSQLDDDSELGPSPSDDSLDS